MCSRNFHTLQNFEFLYKYNSTILELYCSSRQIAVEHTVDTKMSPTSPRAQSSPWTNRLLVFIATLLSVLVVQNFRFSTNSETHNLKSATSTQSPLEVPFSTSKLEPNYLLLKSPESKPSIRTTPEEEANIKRKRYGGVGDKPHLGISPRIQRCVLILCIVRRVYGKG